MGLNLNPISIVTLLVIVTICGQPCASIELVQRSNSTKIEQLTQFFNGRLTQILCVQAMFMISDQYDRWYRIWSNSSLSM